MKYVTTIRLDHEVFLEGTKIIRESLKSNLSKEVENYLKALINAHKKQK